MSSAAATPANPGFTENQRVALLTLLADEDPAVWQAVRQKILSCDPLAEPWLRPHSLSSDPVTRRRVQEILHELARQKADDQFLSFCLNQGEDFDQESAAWLLARTRYPEINVAAYQALLDSYATDLAQRIQNARPGRETLRIMNRYLVRDLGYNGNETDYYQLDNSYLNRVIDRRTGNPISLCMVYLFLAKRLQLPVSGIAMPGHFICRFQSSTETIYIDVFNQGQLLSKADCIRYLQHSTYFTQHNVLSPASSRRILLRMCSNLHQIYHRIQAKPEINRLQRYVVALSR
jgi:regulator of sirC expression with transglutaminase-like and TPR domain